VTRSVTILTGSADDGLPDHDWQSLAAKNQALAIYMGVGNAGLIQARLLNAGIDPETPVTIVENGTLDEQRTFETVIGNLYGAIRTEHIAGPAMIYVGLARIPAANVVPFPTAERIAS
jgi:uroporphyrin-III C-methyltransferase/precorrin-2 dehydrogenase/sirohydrochlorin ferrochelatase